MLPSRIGIHLLKESFRVSAQLQSHKRPHAHRGDHSTNRTPGPYNHTSSVPRRADHGATMYTPTPVLSDHRIRAASRVSIHLAGTWDFFATFRNNNAGRSAASNGNYWLRADPQFEFATLPGESTPRARQWLLETPTSVHARGFWRNLKRESDFTLPPSDGFCGNCYAIILPGSHRMSCGKATHRPRPMMIQITKGQTPLMMSAIVTPSSGAADPLR